MPCPGGCTTSNGTRISWPDARQPVQKLARKKEGKNRRLWLTVDIHHAMILTEVNANPERTKETTMKTHQMTGLFLLGLAVAVALSGWLTVAGTIGGLAICMIQAK